MVFIIALIVAAVFLRLCAKPMRAHPSPFYVAAALMSAAVIALYWTAPDFLSLSLRNKLPIWIGAFGTACFVFVMFIGALPNGNPLVKHLMPIRGELSIFACIITLGHNLSFGKNYLTPGYLFSGPLSATKVAAWISLILIILMLVLTVTSIKKVRKRFKPKKWKALQRLAYLFYALIYVHVLLLSIPNAVKGRSGYGLTLLVYSLVYLSYALCRIQKAVLVKRGQAPKVTGRRQLASAGIGVALSLVLFGGTCLAAGQDNGPAETSLQSENSISEDIGITDPETSVAPDMSSPEISEAEPGVEELTEDDADPTEEPGGEDADEQGSDAEPEPAPVGEPDAEPTEELAAEPTAEPASDPTPEPTAEPTPESTPEPTPEPALETGSKYKDGTFTGTGNGYAGPVTVSVTISGDKITGITVTSHVDDEEYMGSAKTGVITSILLFQSTNVSAVSGATYSSEGIMDAVADALKSAAN